MGDFMGNAHKCRCNQAVVLQEPVAFFPLNYLSPTQYSNITELYRSDQLLADITTA